MALVIPQGISLDDVVSMKQDTDKFMGQISGDVKGLCGNEQEQFEAYVKIIAHVAVNGIDSIKEGISNILEGDDYTR